MVYPTNQPHFALLFIHECSKGVTFISQYKLQTASCGVARGENTAQIDNLSDIKVKIKMRVYFRLFPKYIDGTSHEGCTI